MNKRVLIKIENIKTLSVTKELIKYNIYYKNIEQKNTDVTLKINLEDFNKIKAIFKPKKVKKIAFLGPLNYLYNLKKHSIFILSIIISYFIIMILSNTIFFINIRTNNTELKEELLKDLKTLGIAKYERKKTHKELNTIKETILNEHKDDLEWLEIKESGVTYNIELTERIIKEENNTTDQMNIVAEKDALITKIITTKGTNVKYVNEYVKKGEVIISAEVIKNEEVVALTSAEGKVMGEVWYTVTTTVPYNFIEYSSTGQKINHYYINFLGGKMTLLGKYNEKLALTKETTLIDKPYLSFKLVKETKEIYKYTDYKLTEEEAYNEALKRSDKSINVKLSEEEYIIDKKVLKKNVFSSKIEVEVFYRVQEDIAKKEKYIKKEIPKE